MTDPEGFRKETRAWLDASCPMSMRWSADRTGNAAAGDDLVWGGRKWQWADADSKRWLEVMAERGWTAPTWPRGYGGGGLSKQEAKILAEEMAKLRLRPPLTGFGLSMIGPLLL